MKTDKVRVSVGARRTWYLRNEAWRLAVLPDLSVYKAAWVLEPGHDLYTITLTWIIFQIDVTLEVPR